MKSGHRMQSDNIPPSGSRNNDLAVIFSVKVLSLVLELRQ